MKDSRPYGKQQSLQRIAICDGNSLCNSKQVGQSEAARVKVDAEVLFRALCSRVCCKISQDTGLGADGGSAE